MHASGIFLAIIRQFGVTHFASTSSQSYSLNLSILQPLEGTVGCAFSSPSSFASFTHTFAQVE